MAAEPLLPSELLVAIFAKDPTELDFLMERTFGARGALYMGRRRPVITEQALTSLAVVSWGMAHTLERVRRNSGYPEIEFPCDVCHAKEVAPPPLSVPIAKLVETFGATSAFELDTAMAQVEGHPGADALLTALVTVNKGVAQAVERFRRNRKFSPLKLRCLDCNAKKK